MFPNDEIANLNAANAAIRRDDFETAHRYLDKAGDSAEAVYARGALAIRKKDYNTARRYLSKAKEMGFEDARRTERKIAMTSNRQDKPRDKEQYFQTF